MDDSAGLYADYLCAPDHDSYFGYHVTPKLYGNWTLDETWALKGRLCGL